MNISAAWAVDREFVHILGSSGEVSNLLWHDFELFLLSGVCSGLSRSTSTSEARDEFSKFVWESELSTSAYSDNIWPTGKISKKCGQKHMCFSVKS